MLESSSHLITMLVDVILNSIVPVLFCLAVVPAFQYSVVLLARSAMA